MAVRWWSPRCSPAWVRRMAFGALNQRLFTCRPISGVKHSVGLHKPGDVLGLGLEEHFVMETSRPC